jgi:hypothetical protein
VPLKRSRARRVSRRCPTPFEASENMSQDIRAGGRRRFEARRPEILNEVQLLGREERASSMMAGERFS